MTYQSMRFARTYARAFLNAHHKTFQAEDLAVLKNLLDFFEINTNLYMALQIPSISMFLKKQAIATIKQELLLPDSLELLMDLLLAKGQISALKDILNAIVREYEQRHQIINFRVTTSHELSKDDKETVNAFIKDHVVGVLSVNFDIDSSLVVGIRIESTMRLWERSIRKQLSRIEQAVIAKGAL